MSFQTYFNSLLNKVQILKFRKSVAQLLVFKLWTKLRFVLFICLAFVRFNSRLHAIYLFSWRSCCGALTWVVVFTQSVHTFRVHQIFFLFLLTKLGFFRFICLAFVCFYSRLHAIYQSSWRSCCGSLIWVDRLFHTFWVHYCFYRFVWIWDLFWPLLFLSLRTGHDCCLNHSICLATCKRKRF